MGELDNSFTHSYGLAMTRVNEYVMIGFAANSLAGKGSISQDVVYSAAEDRSILDLIEKSLRDSALTHGYIPRIATDSREDILDAFGSMANANDAADFGLDRDMVSGWNLVSAWCFEQIKNRAGDQDATWNNN